MSQTESGFTGQTGSFTHSFIHSSLVHSFTHSCIHTFLYPNACSSRPHPAKLRLNTLNGKPGASWSPTPAWLYHSWDSASQPGKWAGACHLLVPRWSKRRGGGGGVPITYRNTALSREGTLGRRLPCIERAAGSNVLNEPILQGSNGNHSHALGGDREGSEGPPTEEDARQPHKGCSGVCSR